MRLASIILVAAAVFSLAANAFSRRRLAAVNDSTRSDNASTRSVSPKISSFISALVAAALLLRLLGGSDLSIPKRCQENVGNVRGDRIENGEFG